MDEIRGRRSIRLPDYDYANEGVYFVTICVHQRVCLFGDVADGEMKLNVLGRIAQDEWLKTPTIRAEIELDKYVIMPNHFHAIVLIVKPDEKSSRGDTVGARQADTHNTHAGTVGARRAVPLQPQRREFGRPIARSLPTIIGAFKSAVTKRVNEHRETPGARLWQRNYYEHVIRNESVLNDIRSYIETNPARWAEDQENPANVGQ